MLYRKVLLVALIGLVTICAQISSACVGRTLYIGALNSPEEKIMSEMLALLINERTGTTIQTRYFDTTADLYKALKSNEEEERVDIFVEDTVDALTILSKKASSVPENDLLTIKESYEKDFNVIWLNPFGFNNSKDTERRSITAPLVRRDVLTNFPLLPRVLNKLAGAISDKTYLSLNKKVTNGEKPKNAAKNFLKKKKFI